MTPILLALLVFAATGGLISWLLRRPSQGISRPVTVRERDESQLANLRWRDFARLVVSAMRARGYEPVLEPGMSLDGVPSDGGDILLERDGEITLLSCKYGSAAVVGVQAIMGLSKSAKLRGASNVILTTPGRFDPEAMRVARQQGNIELMDGKDLWPELRPYIAIENPEPEPAPEAAPMPPQHATAIAWGGAAVAALLAWGVAYGLGGDTPDAAPLATGPTTAATATTPVTPQVEAPAAAATAETIPTDPAVLERRRNETANSISTLFGVDRALWSTQSTLMVYLSSESADPMNELCPLLERHPELAASRVQLQPPPGSDKPVRFRQCRAY